METAEEQEDIKNKKKIGYFDRQRNELIGEVSRNLEQVLQALNKLNRSLEGVIAVGNELGSVEALWTQFETVMAHNPEGSDEHDGGKNAN